MYDYQSELSTYIQESVAFSLKEDIGEGDITAQLIPEQDQAKARVITRTAGVIAGQQWVNEVFNQVDSTVEVVWHVKDGQSVEANEVLFELEGNTRSLLTGERAALNFLQSLSAVATATHHYVKLIEHTDTVLLDTRKTIPGLRLAQKYAVTCGGGQNHRIGLFDAFLIKENHIMGCGSIKNAVKKAQQVAPGKPVEVEVETLAELSEAMEAGADIVMLDNFSNDDKRVAVKHVKDHFEATGKRVKLEASGGINDATIVGVAETGVDFISVGSLTKDIVAMDLSMRLVR